VSGDLDVGADFDVRLAGHEIQASKILGYL
jgi:hypothetical protein